MFPAPRTAPLRVQGERGAVAGSLDSAPEIRQRARLPIPFALHVLYVRSRVCSFAPGSRPSSSIYLGPMYKSRVYIL